MSRSTLDPAASLPRFAYGALTLSGRSFQDRSAAHPGRFRSPYPGVTRTPVWAPPVSLAATSGITIVFSSSGYLDVSVPPGSPPRAMDSRADTRVFPAWVPPFRHLRFFAYVPLPAAFRSLSRLSSAPSAKASALRPFWLDLPPVRLAWRRGALFSFLSF